MKRIFATLALLFFFQPSSSIAEQTRVRVGSKNFTENIILGDMAAHLARSRGHGTTHTRQLGGTRILWNALLKGDIDVYPEYTGTITNEIFAGKRIDGVSELREHLLKHGIKMTEPLGFNNTYALGIKQKLAEELGLTKISDLMKHPQLRFGFSSEFMERADGWPGLRSRYNLPQKSVKGLEHDLAYRGLETGSLDVIDMYSTDAEIEYYDLVALEDDKNYFPHYGAVLLYRVSAIEQLDNLEQAWKSLEGKINATLMSSLNARSKFEKVSTSVVAADYLNSHLGLNIVGKKRTLWPDLMKNTKNHLLLVFISLSFAVIAAIPLGIAAAKLPRFGRLILGVVGIMQTIPSLALLVFMIPLLGIGTMPAIVALFCYSLLPIIRNTYQGLVSTPPHLLETAQALGLSPWARLFQLELPLAAGAIFAGIKTAAVINIGTATLGALIGAGGYGQPILTGIRLDDMQLILFGAVPAALMALTAEFIFEYLERKVFSH